MPAAAGLLSSPSSPVAPMALAMVNQTGSPQVVTEALDAMGSACRLAGRLAGWLSRRPTLLTQASQHHDPCCPHLPIACLQITRCSRSTLMQ